MKNVINTEYVDKQGDSNVLVIRVYKTSETEYLKRRNNVCYIFDTRMTFGKKYEIVQRKVEQGNSH